MPIGVYSPDAVGDLAGRVTRQPEIYGGPVGPPELLPRRSERVGGHSIEASVLLGTLGIRPSCLRNP